MSNGFRALKVDRLELNARRLLDRLEQWENRLEGHFTQKRTHERLKARGRIAVVVPPPGSSPANLARGRRVEVWTRNVSQGGICFIANEPIPVDQLVLQLRFADGTEHLFLGQIVRRRQVDEHFWEYGVSFVKRLDSAAPPARSAASGSEQEGEESAAARGSEQTERADAVGAPGDGKTDRSERESGGQASEGSDVASARPAPQPSGGTSGTTGTTSSDQEPVSSATASDEEGGSDGPRAAGEQRKSSADEGQCGPVSAEAGS